jgi:hypothetical protein
VTLVVATSTFVLYSLSELHYHFIPFRILQIRTCLWCRKIPQITGSLRIRFIIYEHNFVLLDDDILNACAELVSFKYDQQYILHKLGLV